MPSYIAEEQRGAEARILNALFPTILQSLQLAHQAADQFGARPRQQQRWEQRPVEYPQFRPEPAPPELYDRPFMDVVSVVMPVVQAITPPLVEQLLAFGPPKADTDQNEEDRFAQFVPQLIGTITPIVIQVLPGRLQAMRGARTEHPVRVTDRELNQRYFGPLLQATLPAIVSALPELLAIVHGDQRAPVRYERMPGRAPMQLIRVTRNDLVNGHRLRDGDVVHLSEAAGPPGTTEIRISAAPHSAWWKGVEVTGEGDRQICFVETEGRTQVRFESRALENGGHIVLWKAQLYGARTPMYVIPAGDLSPDARSFTFHWAAD